MDRDLKELSHVQELIFATFVSRDDNVGYFGEFLDVLFSAIPLQPAVVNVFVIASLTALVASLKLFVGRGQMDVVDFRAVCLADCLNLARNAGRVHDIQASRRLSGRVSIYCPLKSLADPSATVRPIESLSCPLQRGAHRLCFRQFS